MAKAKRPIAMRKTAPKRGKASAKPARKKTAKRATPKKRPPKTVAKMAPRKAPRQGVPQEQKASLKVAAPPTKSTQLADLVLAPKSLFGEIQEAVDDCATVWLRQHNKVPPSVPPGDPLDQSGIMNKMYAINSPQEMKTFLQDMKACLRAKRLDYYKMDTSNQHLLKLLTKSLSDVESDIGSNTRLMQIARQNREQLPPT